MLKYSAVREQSLTAARKAYEPLTQHKTSRKVYRTGNPYNSQIKVERKVYSQRESMQTSREAS